MNYFFGINNSIFKSELQIPLFQNRNFKKTNISLFKTYPKNNKWNLEQVSSKKINDYFFILKKMIFLVMKYFF